jgi:HPt (histidine-containing phosphotransfer) domain-containing protein
VAAKGVTARVVALARLEKRIETAMAKRDKTQEALDAAETAVQALRDEWAWVGVPPASDRGWPKPKPPVDILEGAEEFADNGEPEADVKGEESE